MRAVAELAVASREVEMARALEHSSVPAVRLATSVGPPHPSPLLEKAAQPWQVGSWVVTGWNWVEGAGAPTSAQVGGLCRTLAERTGGLGLALASFDPLGAIVAAVAHLAATDGQASFVRARAADLAAQWVEAAADDPAGRSLVHGDLHADNVLVGPTGPILADLELAGMGPGSFDVTPAVVAVERYGAHPDSLLEFLGAYGRDPRGWAGFATFIAVYELWVTAWAVGVRDRSPSAQAEASRRVRCLQDGTCEPWHLS